MTIDCFQLTMQNVQKRNSLGPSSCQTPGSVPCLNSTGSTYTGQTFHDLGVPPVIRSPKMLNSGCLVFISKVWSFCVNMLELFLWRWHTHSYAHADKHTHKQIMGKPCYYLSKQRNAWMECLLCNTPTPDTKPCITTVRLTHFTHCVREIPMYISN